MFTTDSFTFQNNDYIKLTASSIEYLKSKPSQEDLIVSLTEIFENRLAQTDLINHPEG